MPTSSGSDGSWLSLLDDKKKQIHDLLRPDLVRSVGNFRTFRTKLEAFCSKKGEFQRTPILTTAINNLDRPSLFARCIHECTPDFNHLSAVKGLEGLIWDTALGLIELGSERYELRVVVSVLARLNKAFPEFSLDRLKEFATDDEVQQPLRNAFMIYMEAQAEYLLLFTNDVPIPVEELKSISKPDDMYQRLQKERGTYDLMVKQAAEEREKRLAEQNQPKLEHIGQQPNLVHHDSTSDRSVAVQFVTQKLLGKGSYGEVYEVAETSTGAVFARKCIHIDLDKSVGRREEDVAKEVRIMQRLRHPHITTVLFHARLGDTFSIFITPVAEFDLKVLLASCAQNGFPTSVTKHMNRWCGCLMDALTYAHECRIKHQDIKPENILIKENTPYLSDFGLAKDFANLDESASRGDRGQGNLMYRAPEVELNVEHGRKADVFSLGCVFSEMFTVSQGRSVNEYVAARRQKAYRWCLPEVTTWMQNFDCGKLNDILKDEILDMLKKEPKERPKAREALNRLKQDSAFFCVETH